MIRDTVANHGGQFIYRLDPPYGELKHPPTGFSIIIPTYNRAENLRHSLESIVRQENPGIPVQIVVINDGSTDHTSEVVASIKLPRWVDLDYHETGIDEWTSPAKAYNIGFALTRHDYFIHSGADIVWASPKMLKEISLTADIDRYLIFNYYELDVNRRLDVDVFEYINYATRGSTTLYPWCLVTSKEMMSRIGFYHSDYLPGAGEDDGLIFCMQAIGAKFCRLANQAIVNQEHKKQYTRDAKWQRNTNFNVRLGMQHAAQIRKDIATGLIQKF